MLHSGARARKVFTVQSWDKQKGEAQLISLSKLSLIFAVPFLLHGRLLFRFFTVAIACSNVSLLFAVACSSRSLALSSSRSLALSSRSLALASPRSFAPKAGCLLLSSRSLVFAVACLFDRSHGYFCPQPAEAKPFRILINHKHI
jgi:hypothetical protein